MIRSPYLVVLALLAVTACGDDPPVTTPLLPDEIPLAVAQTCPGDPSCPDQGDGRLLAGYAARDIGPALEPFEDKNNNQRWDMGEPYTDTNSNGRYDDYWMFNSGRSVTGVHDPIWARCLALRRNQTTAVVCALDLGGFMYDEMKDIRARLDPGLGVDLLLTAATHTHSAPDSIGIFGPDTGITGYRPEWMKDVRTKIAAAATEAVNNLKAAKLSIGSIPVEEGPSHDMKRLIDDTRDPVVIDNVLHILQLDGEDGKPIATLINWTAHPDSNTRGNHLISSEFPHYLREEVEKHTGSPALYVSGSVGGQIGPGRIRPITDDGVELPCGERGYRFIEAWGKSISRFANKAFDMRKPVASPDLRFRTSHFNVHIENVGYQLAFKLQLIPRTAFGYDPKKPLIRDESGDNTPLVDTEVAYLRVGPAAIVTVPGELQPELLVGGYDASKKGTWEPFIHTGPIADDCDPSKIKMPVTQYPEPPDVTKAPKPPYLFDLMGGEPEHRMVFGLTGDMLGYVIPPYNFYLDPLAPYLAEPPGDHHYEETNSIGPRAAPEIVGTLRQLVIATENK